MGLCVPQPRPYRGHIVDVCGAHHGPADGGSPLLWKHREKLGRLTAVGEKWEKERSQRGVGEGRGSESQAETADLSALLLKAHKLLDT